MQYFILLYGIKYEISILVLAISDQLISKITLKIYKINSLNVQTKHQLIIIALQSIHTKIIIPNSCLTNF